MKKSMNNSVIYRNPVQDENLIDFTQFGTTEISQKTMILTEPMHYFSVGDAIYYDFKNDHFKRGLAINNIMSEIFGVVSKIIDNNTFEITLDGSITTDRYDNIKDGSMLYLSPIVPGKLIDTEPNIISKIIGIKIKEGINVNIQRGIYLERLNASQEEAEEVELRYYTEQEIQDLIDQIIKDIY